MKQVLITTMGVVFYQKHKEAVPDHIGLVTMMLNPDAKGTAVQQLDAGYGHGGGWRPFEGFKMLEDGNMQYGDPNEENADPPTQLLWEAQFNDETIRVYQNAWFAVVQKDGSFEVCRMD
jgi:hypothetical protein